MSSCAGSGSRSPRDYVALNSIYTHYTDLKRSNNASTDKSIPATYDVELGLRYHSLFQFITVGSESPDQERRSIGFGLRIDTPGFFWLGGRKATERSAKNYPLNSSVFALAYRAIIESESGIVTTYMGSNIGLGVDIFLFNPYLYLTLQASYLTERSNVYSTYSVGQGLGI